MITSTANAKVKRLIQLRKKRKARDREKVFLVEGIRMFRELPEGWIREIYVTENFLRKERALLEQKAGKAGVRVEVFSEHVCSLVSDTETPQGVLCVARQMAYTLEDILRGAKGQRTGKHPPCLLALDNLQDPGNLGTILRTCEGAGLNGVVMSENCVDIYNPKTIRATMGSVYRLPFFYASDIRDVLGRLKQKGMFVYAARLKAGKIYDMCDYTKACVFLIGNEGNGLRDEVARMADVCIEIPMQGQAESLNAATAAAVLAFEASRQRRRAVTRP